jgi:hypothetical protein
MHMLWHVSIDAFEKFPNNMSGKKLLYSRRKSKRVGNASTSPPGHASRDKLGFSQVPTLEEST